MTLGRTSAGKIKIKSDGDAGLRAVECACCNPQPSCCMYEASLADKYDYENLGYRASDLPETLIVNLNSGTYLLNKSGASYASGDSSVTLFSNGIDSWVIQSTNQGDTTPISYGACLITGNLVQDQFASSYNVELRSELGNILTIPINRVSLCVWEAEAVLSIYFSYYDVVSDTYEDVNAQIKYNLLLTYLTNSDPIGIISHWFLYVSGELLSCDDSGDNGLGCLFAQLYLIDYFSPGDYKGSYTSDPDNDNSSSPNQGTGQYGYASFVL